MKKNILTLLIIFFAAQVGAQTHDLQSFLALVEKNSKDLQIARKDLDMARAIKKEAWATALPKIFAQGDYKRNLLENYLYVDFPGMGKQKFKISRNNEYRFNTVLQQTLFSFKVGDALTAAKQYQKLSGYVFEAQHQGVLSFAKKGFYQALLLKKVLQVSRSSLQSAKDNYKNIKDKYDNGLVSELELMQAEMRWKNQIPAVTEAEKNYRLLMENLKNFAGLKSDETLEFMGSLETYPPKPQRIKTAEALVLRPDYNALLWEKNLRKTDVKSQYSNYLPSLEGSAVFAFSSISDEWKLEDQNKNFILGLTLSIPIYTGGYTGAQVQKARINLDKTKIKIQQTREKIQVELESIYLRLDEAEQRIASTRSTLETAKKAYAIAQSSADDGLITQLDLRDTRVYLDQATLGYYFAVFDYLNAYFDWERAAGK